MTSQHTQEHRWSSDRPGTLPTDDELDRCEFAKRIANELNSWHGNESLVVSCSGEWGSGKTTLKNLICHYLKEESGERKKGAPVVVNFNPWQWSGQGKLIEAFFARIGDQLVATGREDLVSFWEKLGKITSAGSEYSRKLQESLVAASALISAGAGTIAVQSSDPTSSAILGSISIGLFVFTGALGVFTPVSEAIARTASRLGRKQKESIETVRQKLEQELRKLRSPVVVTIDDIDRLSRSEIRLIFQLVKANADLPNLVYLLLYQKNVVSDSLEKFVGERGHSFLKKIVQVELEVPQAPDAELKKLFTTPLLEILNTAEHRWNRDRWGQIFNEAVWPFFNTPRDIKRFHGMLSFYFEGHVLDGVLEVNPIDLILLEILRTFDPSAYDSLSHAFQQRRSILHEIMYGDEEAKQHIELNIAGLVDRDTVSPSEKPRLKALLFALFPQAIEGGTDESESAWKADLRICHPAHFPKYFHLGKLPNTPTASAIAKLLKRNAEHATRTKVFSEAIEANYIGELLQRLGALAEEVPESEIVPISKSLMDLSDDLPEAPLGSIFTADPDREAGQFVANLCSKIENSSERIRAIEEILDKTATITGPLMLVSYLDSIAKHQPDHRELAFGTEERDRFKALILKRLWRAVKSGAVWNMRRSAFLLYRLREWDLDQKVEDVVKEAAKEPRVAISFLECMLNRSQESGGHETRITYYIRPTEFKQWVKLEQLIMAAEPAARTVLQKAAIAAAKKAVKLGSAAPEEIHVLTLDPEGNVLKRAEFNEST